MKKICYVTTIPLTLKAFVLETAKYIHENTDWDITFICDYDEEFEKTLPDYIHYQPVSMKRGISLSGIKSMLKIAKIFKREKFDLIQYSTPNASLYASLAGKIAKIPVRLYCQWGIAYVGFSGIKRKIFKMIEKFVCSLSTWVEPDSNSNLRFAHSEKLYPENKGSVIWNGSASGVNLDKFDINKKEQYNNEIREKYNLPSEAFVYGFVGRITKDKGINELLYSFKRINEECKNVYLILVGPNEVTQGIDEELYEWSLNSLNVIYTGFTNEVEKYISAMDVYILPSYREGFGSGVIEAEAMGVPVIVSDIPGPTDAMKNGKTGIIVKKADAQSLYTAMKNVFEEKDKCSVMADNAIEFVKSSFEQKTLFSYMLDDRKKLLGE